MPVPLKQSVRLKNPCLSGRKNDSTKDYYKKMIKRVKEIEDLT